MPAPSAASAKTDTVACRSSDHLRSKYWELEKHREKHVRYIQDVDMRRNKLRDRNKMMAVDYEAKVPDSDQALVEVENINDDGSVSVSVGVKAGADEKDALDAELQKDDNKNKVKNAGAIPPFILDKLLELAHTWPDVPFLERGQPDWHDNDEHYRTDAGYLKKDFKKRAEGYGGFAYWYQFHTPLGPSYVNHGGQERYEGQWVAGSKAYIPGKGE